MADLGYTFSVQPYKERINGTVHLKFKIQDIEQDYDFIRFLLVESSNQYAQTIQNAIDEKAEKDYFIEIYDNLPDPPPEQNIIIEETM